MYFDYQPVLRGDRVELRPLRSGDFDALYAVASDPLIWAQHPDRNRHEPESFRAFFEESLASRAALIVIDRRTREVIGSARFHGFDELEDVVEIGWVFLARSHWGGVFNAETTLLMARHAFRFVRRIVWLAALENVRSQRAIEKLGGRRVGSRPDAGGRESFVYELTDSDLH